MSIIGTFSVMYLLDYSLDNLSLMALTLAVGFVVDDAIVMLENIVRHMEMGKPPMQAAIDGAAEVGFTILSMTISLTAVFIPFLFMGGIIGRLFHEFAVTIGVAILVSGFVSLTLTPMLSSRFLKSDHGKKHGRLYNATERFYDGLLGVYERTLAWVMARRPLDAGLLGRSFSSRPAYLFWSMPKGLFPTDDTGQLLATTEAAEGVSFDALVEHQQRGRRRRCSKDPDVRSVTSSVGTTAAANQGQLTIDLKPIDERKRSAEEIARDLTHATHGVPDITAFMQNPPAISIGGLASKSLYQYTLQSGDINALNTAARELERRLRAAPGAHRRDERSADRESAGHRRHRSRAGRPARRVGERDREHALRRVRPAAGVDDLHADQRVLGRDGAAAAVPAGRRRARQAVGALARAVRSCRSAPSRSSRTRVGPGDGESLRPAAVGDGVVQPRAGRLARHGGQGGAEASRREVLPATVAHELLRHRRRRS